jgi:hypothetical protein
MYDLLQASILLLISIFMTSSVGLCILLFSVIIITGLGYFKRRFKFDFILLNILGVIILSFFPI